MFSLGSRAWGHLPVTRQSNHVDKNSQITKYTSNKDIVNVIKYGLKRKYNHDCNYLNKRWDSLLIVIS